MLNDLQHDLDVLVAYDLDLRERGLSSPEGEAKRQAEMDDLRARIKAMKSQTSTGSKNAVKLEDMVVTIPPQFNTSPSSYVPPVVWTTTNWVNGKTVDTTYVCPTCHMTTSSADPLYSCPGCGQAIPLGYTP